VRPVAFRITNFKSIKDSKVCHLSADGITVLAGENESGKTAILSALRDFNLAQGEAPETKDYLPDDDLELQPRVSVRFEIDWTRKFTDFEEENIFILPDIKKLLERVS